MTTIRSLPFALAASLLLGCGGSSATGVATPDDTGVDATAPDQGAEAPRDDTGAEVNDASDAPDAAPDWPTCDSKPLGAAPTTIADLWANPPSTPSSSWIPGAYVTAISGAGCSSSATAACQIFLADATSYADLNDAARRAIRLMLWPPASPHFAGVQVGDQVDVAAFAYRDTAKGANELLLDVSDTRRGCARKVGSGAVSPVAATLSDLGSATAYEVTYGPVLVQLSAVSATTDSKSVSKTTGGLFYPASFDAGSSEPVSVSPYCLSGGTFTAYQPNTRYDFVTLTGVFGVFRPQAPADGGVPPTYLEIYPRTMADLVR